MVQHLYLAMVLAAFATFMITLGSVSTWQRLSALRDEAKAKPDPASPELGSASPRLTSRAAHRPY